ncbi:portal protein [Lactobacillus phage ATCC8014]|uniref:Minor capsid protein n=1 Tax=Lactobacillus phage ATCC8014 TaxID=2892340 RepID=K4I466_9CAUD|nr:portal protein [Lactobacillus phage ATCC8014]AFU63010.1 minor capsid protein [Lactobacillus phage ATCC8014]
MIDMQQANMNYQEDADKLTPTRIAAFIRHHYNNQRPRLEMLYDYYRGQNDGILSPASRRNEKGKADHRAVHSFARYIADFQTSYSVGNAIAMSGPSSDRLDDFNRRNDIDTLNYELYLDMTVTGRAYEYVYRDPSQKGEVSVKLDPMECFIIYDRSVNPKPIMAVRYHAVQTVVDNITQTKYEVETWTENDYTRYKPIVVAGSVPTLEVAEHSAQFGFPMIEYRNNEYRQGDFENVLSLIDLYDVAQSDTANYMTDLNEAMLVIKGDIDTLFDDSTLLQMVDPSDADAMKKLADEKMAQLEAMRQANMILLKTGMAPNGQQTSADANYIHKEYDSAGTELYKKRLAADIHKFSHTPDLTDDNFSGNSSGVAMKYKVLGTVELASTKRKQFERGLNQRYTVVAHIEERVNGKWDIDPDEIGFIFRDNLPTDDVAIITALVQAGAQIPQEYLYQYLPNVTDADEIVKMMDKQRKAMLKTYDTKGGLIINGTSGNDPEDEGVRGQQGEPEDERTSD